MRESMKDGPGGPAGHESEPTLTAYIQRVDSRDLSKYHARAAVSGLLTSLVDAIGLT
jgi:hypothetical protein